MRAGEVGFTLLEAVVALVVIASLGVAALSWINRNLAALTSIERADARVVAVRNALDWMETINPMRRPEGVVELGEPTVAWSSRALFEPRDGIAPSLYRLALYDTEVVVRHDGREVKRFILRQVGYAKVQDALLAR